MTIRVGLVDLWNVTNVNGGVERVLCNMANALTRRGFAVDVICCDESCGVPDFPLDKDVRFWNFGSEAVPFYLRETFRRFRAIRLTREQRRLARSLYFLRSIAYKIGDFILKQNFDVLVSFQVSTTYVLKNILKIPVPVISMFHGAPESYVDKKFELFYRDCVERSGPVQVLIPEYLVEARRILPNISPEEIVVIPNAIPQSAKSSSLSNKKVINVGRLDPQQKRQHLLVEAFARIRSDFPGWTLEFWGDDKYSPRYTGRILELINDLGLTDSVFIRGISSNIEEKLLSASIFAFPSEMEGFSLALGEAMSAGLPVIGCSDCVSVRSLVPSGVCGFITEPTADALAAGLASLMRDESLRRRMGGAAQLQMKKYAPDVVWGRWELLIRSLVSRKERDA